MNKIAKFEKVSFEQFKNDWINTYGDENINEIQSIYNNIKLPTRATKESAGYDFKAPTTIYLEPNETIKIPTGIRTKIAEGWVLMCYPRSGLGFKCRLQLNNTVGIIDSDYYDSKNEGHIFAKITNDSNEGKSIYVDNGEGFMQGVFTPFGITEDDEDDKKEIRNGGIGSTSKK